MEWVQLKNITGDAFAVRVGDIENAFCSGNSMFVKVRNDAHPIELSGDTFDGLMQKIMRAESGVY